MSAFWALFFIMDASFAPKAKGDEASHSSCARVRARGAAFVLSHLSHVACRV
jgi:hypothetical protein